MYCPFTHCSIINLAVHLRFLKKQTGRPTKDLRFEIMQHNYPTECSQAFVTDRYVTRGWSLPDFQREVGWNYEQTQFVLDWFKVPKRGLVAATKACVGKRVATCKERYGVSNPSQTPEVKEKKRQTFIKHYGVDNVWKTPEFKAGLDGFYLERYGLDYSDFQKGRSTKVWNDKSPEDRERWLQASILSEDARQRKPVGNRVSKLEDIVSSLLDDLTIHHSRQMELSAGKQRRAYDLCIPALRLIIEVNGDYWHANPAIYAATDVITYPFGKRVAQWIWDRDRAKADLAAVHGYAVIYLWEAEIIKATKPEIKTLIERRICERVNQSN